MISSPIPENESERLEALHCYGILDNEAYACMQPLTKLAADICECPIALIPLIDDQRQWFYTNVGLEGTTETPRDISFCGHVICDRKTMVINDATKDERFVDNPLVTNAPYIKFYASVPLINKDGYALGTICVIDHVPRKITKKQILLLERLAEVIVSKLDDDLLGPQAKLYLDDIENKCAMYSSLLSTETLGIVIFDNNGAIIDQNGCFKSTWNINDELLIDNNPEKIKAHLKNQVAIPEEYINHSGESSDNIDTESIDILHMKNGMVLERHDYPFVKDNKPIARVCLFRNITENHNLTKELNYQATHDLLTNLNNRFEFERRLDRIISEVQKDSKEHVLCFMDLDNFKIINDSFGHASGDYLLQEVSKTFSQHIRQRDTLARIGGDEFGLLMENCTIKQAKRVAKKLVAALDECQFKIENEKVEIGISIGVIAIDASSKNKNVILKKADVACYKAKKAGRNRIQVG